MAQREKSSECFLNKIEMHNIHLKREMFENVSVKKIRRALEHNSLAHTLFEAAESLQTHKKDE